ncbi:TetR family transcriptional regulator C-terminal domain-containing protein [Streptomyces decoyicus]
MFARGPAGSGRAPAPGRTRLTTGLGARVADRVRAAGDAPGPREMIEAVLLEALPTDEESRTFHLVYTAYAVLAVTDEALAAQPFIDGPDAAEDMVAGQLERGREAGLTAPGTDVRTEAISLLALSAGLGTSVLVGQRTPEAAAAVLRHHLDRLFPACG